jgi:hypothetical protein
MANMVSRLQTLKLVLKQPEPASVFKVLDAIRPKTLADKGKDILRIKEMDPNEWVVKEVGDIAIRLEKAQGKESLWTTQKRPRNVTKPIKGKPWCSLHKINTHALESCWVLHPELRPSYLKEEAAQSARQAEVVYAKLESSLNVKPKPALLSATKSSPPDVKKTMDSYFAEVVIDKSPYHDVEPFAVNVRAATT